MARWRLFLPYLVLGVIVVVVVVANLPATNDRSIEQPATALQCPPCGMDVDPEKALHVGIDGKNYYFCAAGCRDSFVAEARESETHSSASRRLVDPVCKMEVNEAWNIRTSYAGQDYLFCADRCREQFDADPEHYLIERCLVCAVPVAGQPAVPATYLGTTYQLCSVEHRAQFKQDPAAYFMHSMWGIPTWLYYGSIALVLIVSFGVFDWMSRVLDSETVTRAATSPAPAHIGRDQIRGEGERMLSGMAARTSSAVAGTIPLDILLPALPVAAGVSATPSLRRADRFDLMTVGWFRAAVRSRVFRFVCQAVIVVAFFLVIAAGLFGNQNPALNIAPILTWTIWWTLLIVVILFAGKAWCYVCPWDAVAGWMEKLSFWRKTDDGLSLGRRWPKVIRNISLATILFVGLTWIELGFGVTMKPRATAYLAIGMLLLAVVSAMLFERKSFCRYGCLVGRVSGLYALFSSVEIRPRHADTCSRCRTKECVKGSETAYGCPTMRYPGKLTTNTYCIQCMECIQACPHDNLAVNLRPWGSDLTSQGKPRTDEAYLALLMLAITGFHGLTMTPVWNQLIGGLRSVVDVGKIAAFSGAMAALMLAPIGIYAVLVGISQRLGRGSTHSPLGYRDYFIQYAYALLPIALFYHIAHNLEHLLMEGPKVLALVSDPLGWGWNLFGTAAWIVPPLISLDKLWLVQVLLVLIGHVYSLWVAQKTSMRLFHAPRAARRSQVPMLVGMIAFSVFSLWLLKQPMEMRTSAM